MFNATKDLAVLAAEKKLKELHEKGEGDFKLKNKLQAVAAAWEDCKRTLFSHIGPKMSDQYLMMKDDSKIIYQLRSENFNEDICTWSAKNTMVIWSTDDGTRLPVVLGDPTPTADSPNGRGFLNNLGKAFPHYPALGTLSWWSPQDNNMIVTHKMAMAPRGPDGKCQIKLASYTYGVQEFQPESLIICIANGWMSIQESTQGMQTIGVDVLDPATRKRKMHCLETEATGKTIAQQHEESEEERAELLAQGRAVNEYLGPTCLEKVKNRVLIVIVPVQKKSLAEVAALRMEKQRKQAEEQRKRQAEERKRQAEERKRRMEEEAAQRKRAALEKVAQEKAALEAHATALETHAAGIEAGTIPVGTPPPPFMGAAVPVAAVPVGEVVNAAWPSCASHVPGRPEPAPEYRNLAAGATEYRSCGAAAPAFRSLSAASEEAPMSVHRSMGAAMDEAEETRYNACSAAAAMDVEPPKPVLGACTLSVGDEIGDAVGVFTKNLERDYSIPARMILCDFYDLDAGVPTNKEIVDLAKHHQTTMQAMGGSQKLFDTDKVASPFDAAAQKAEAVFAAEKGKCKVPMRETSAVFSF